VAPSIQVREAESDDLSVLHELLKAMHDTSPWDQTKDDHSAQEILESIIAQDSRKLLIAHVNSVPAGTIDVMVIPNLTRDLAPWAMVENVSVLPSFRRMGVGKELIHAAVNFASAAGCYKVQLVSAAKRVAAPALYKSTGFDAEVDGYRRYLIFQAVSAEK
jgi:GNAT superfamily N-acetyltransferase